MDDTAARNDSHTRNDRHIGTDRHIGNGVLSTDDTAHQSVQALLDDVDYVTTVLPTAERRAAAQAVLVHHDPPVPEALLGPEARDAQRQARSTLVALTRSEIELTVEPRDTGPSNERRPSPGRPKSATPKSERRDRWRSVAKRVATVVVVAAVGFAIGVAIQRLL